jgi:hypothetical protein
MVATFVIEMSLAAWTVWRYKFNLAAKLSVLIFVCLAIFQAAEFMVCRGAPGAALPWSRIGYAAIALLPPLGLHLLLAITKFTGRRRGFLTLCYLMAASFIGFFLLAPGALNGHMCLGNYVIFQVAKNSGALFGAYYYGLLLAALLIGWRALKTANKHQKRAIKGLLFAYLVFIVPTIAVSFLSPNTVRGIPSIMCGFAVLMALALAFEVLPATVPRKGKS